MCILESFCRLEVLTHIKNRFVLKSLALVYTCAKKSYFGISFV